MADSLFNNVSLLLPLGGPAGGTTFRDFSANHHTVTAVGNAAAKAVGKYNGSSAYFDGTGDYLTVPDSATFDFDTSDFTIEFMVNFVAHTTVMTLVSNYLNGTIGWVVQYRGDTSILRLGYGDTALIDAAWTPTDGVWYHVAVTRSGTSLKFFVDGVQVGTTATNSTNISGSTSVINIGALNFGAQYFNGYMADLRITKGAARYTETFTPPAGPLRHALDANVVLRLTGEDLFDFSQVGAAITAYGNAAPSATQFKYGTKSLAFDGTGDYITAPNVNLGTAAFTIEGWFYTTTVANLTNFFSMTNGSGSVPKMSLYINSSGFICLDMGNAGSGQFPFGSQAAASLIPTNTWTHIAIVRTATGGTSTVLYINGVAAASGNTGYLSGVTGLLYIGYIGEAYGQMFSGYIDDFTITRRAKYTATFTPPGAALPTETTADEYLTSVVLQLQMDGANASTTFTDTSPTPKTVTAVGNAQISTAQSRFGGTAAYFDGTGDYISAPTGTDFAFGLGDFTVEMWIRPAVVTGITIMYDSRTGSAGSPGGLSMVIDAGVFRIDASSATIMTGGSIVINTWHHVALTRASGVFKAWINGAQVATVTATHDLTDGVMCVGQHGGFYFNGYIDDLRITKGVARYV